MIFSQSVTDVVHLSLSLPACRFRQTLNFAFCSIYSYGHVWICVPASSPFMLLPQVLVFGTKFTQSALDYPGDPSTKFQVMTQPNKRDHRISSGNVVNISYNYTSTWFLELASFSSCHFPRVKTETANALAIRVGRGDRGGYTRQWWLWQLWRWSSEQWRLTPVILKCLV